MHRVRLGGVHDGREDHLVAGIGLGVGERQGLGAEPSRVGVDGARGDGFEGRTIVGAQDLPSRRIALRSVVRGGDGDRGDHRGACLRGHREAGVQLVEVQI
ncbi:MAG: hypothetical protein ACK55I_34155, partial [bacterium]